jgi:RHS repeat-associated protein
MEVNLRFPGQYFDEESNLSYNGFRSYRATMGDFTQFDPIGLAGGSNRRGYVGGNPLNRTDPLGLCPMCLIPGLPFVGEAAVVAATWWASQNTFQTKTPVRGDPGEWHTNPADGKPGNGQERLYGPKGLPEVDIDWHPDHGAGKPHGHNWENGRRGPAVPLSPWPRGRSTNSCPAE